MYYVLYIIYYVLILSGARRPPASRDGAAFCGAGKEVSQAGGDLGSTLNVLPRRRPRGKRAESGRESSPGRRSATRSPKPETVRGARITLSKTNSMNTNNASTNDDIDNHNDNTNINSKTAVITHIRN